jgi:hypothetical protein
MAPSGALLIDIVNVVVTVRDREIRQTQPGGYPGTPLPACQNVEGCTNDDQGRRKSQISVGESRICAVLLSALGELMLSLTES